MTGARRAVSGHSVSDSEDRNESCSLAAQFSHRGCNLAYCSKVGDAATQYAILPTHFPASALCDSSAHRSSATEHAHSGPRLGGRRTTHLRSFGRNLTVAFAPGHGCLEACVVTGDHSSAERKDRPDGRAAIGDLVSRARRSRATGMVKPSALHGIRVTCTIRRTRCNAAVLSEPAHRTVGVSPHVAGNWPGSGQGPCALAARNGGV